jgi:hypothetical protein
VIPYVSARKVTQYQDITLGNATKPVSVTGTLPKPPE